MIIDLEKFIKDESPRWKELEEILNRIENDPAYIKDIDDVKRVHYLYKRASSDLARIVTFTARQDIRIYLESLVARAFAEIHKSRNKKRGFNPFKWFFITFPATFRRHWAAFLITLLIMATGSAFGGFAVSFDKDAKEILMPFEHLKGDPAERVAREESSTNEHLDGAKSSFSSQLMTHNTRISILAMGLGITWGIGTIILIFTNGVMLGAVIADYLAAGQGKFLAGWLLPHGSIEIPAILLAGQAGLVLAHAILGWGNKNNMRSRLRQITPDLVTLIAGVAIMLVWAGFVEAFLSQYHEPVISYELKTGFGLFELILLTLFLCGPPGALRGLSEGPAGG